jgi:hypothetical protein
MKLKITSLIICIGLALNLQAQQNLFRGNNNYAAPSVLVTNVVLSLDANDPLSYSGSGATITNTSGSTFGNGAIIGGVTYTAANGILSAHFTLNGTSGYIDLPGSGSASLGNELSYEFWVRPTALSNSWSTLISFDNYLQGYIHCQFAGNRPAFDVNGAGDNRSTSVAINNWYHMVFTYSKANNRIRYYQNGNEIWTVNGSGYPSIAGNQRMRIGSWEGSGRYLNGNLASVKIFNKILTAAEITQNFNAIKARFGL